MVKLLQQPAGMGGVVEQGSSTNGEYVCFADGTMIAWHEMSLNLAVTLSLGSWYRCGGGAVTWNYPKSFAARPVTTVSTEFNGLVDIFEIPAMSSLCDNTKYAPMFASPTSQTKAVTIRFLAVGRWK